MLGLKEVGLLGASVAVAGGVAFLVWSYASSSTETKTKTRPEPKCPRAEEKERREKEEGEEERREKEEGEEERREEEEPSAAPVVAAKAPTASESLPVEPERTQVLVLGLDGAGKTSLLQCLATSGPEEDTEPTQGFNAISINRGDLHIEFLEIGGKEELRPYWRRYMSKAIVLVFVVDSSDPQLFPLVKKHLHELLASNPHLPLMILANKQDLPGAYNITDLHGALSLSEIGDRKLFLISTHVNKREAEFSSSVEDAWELIIQMVCDSR